MAWTVLINAEVHCYSVRAMDPHQFACSQAWANDSNSRSLPVMSSTVIEASSQGKHTISTSLQVQKPALSIHGNYILNLWLYIPAFFHTDLESKSSIHVIHSFWRDDQPMKWTLSKTLIKIRGCGYGEKVKKAWEAWRLADRENDNPHSGLSTKRWNQYSSLS